MISARSVTCLLLALLLPSLAGCSGGPEKPKWPDPVECVGKVTLDGKPLEKARVFFIPHGSTTGQGGFGITDDSGEFALESADADGKMVNGIVPGKYTVFFSQMIKPDGTIWVADPDSKVGPATVGAREGLPMKYSIPANSKFLIDVIDGGPPQTFTLKKK